MGARRVAVLVMGLNGLWAPNAIATETHGQMQVTATVLVTGTVDARLVARPRLAQNSSDRCAAVSLSATGPLPTRVTFHLPGTASVHQQVSLCPSAVLAMAQSYGGRAPAWAKGQTSPDQTFFVTVEY
jgi:hypothetical protein